MYNPTIKLIVYSILSFAVSSCSIGCVGNVRQPMPSDPNQVMMYMYQQKSLESMAQTLSSTKQNPSDIDLKIELLQNEIKRLKEQVSELNSQKNKSTCKKRVDPVNWIEYDFVE